MDGGAFFRPAPSWSGEQIRFMTAGSVDDGKSTLIGRLLLDSKSLLRDQSVGLDLEEADLAALTDGLEAERAQGITIDVAYRYFATPRTSFIIADAPGHEQYTRNMVTAASVSEVAVLVIDVADVEGGVLKPQTRRHAAIAALLGLELIVAVNKMDLVGWSPVRFADVQGAFRDVAGVLGLRDIAFVPVSAKLGDNVVHRGGADWYTGPTLVEMLESIRTRESLAHAPLRLPVQVVLRHAGTRAYAGRIESGAVRPGDRVRVGAAGVTANIAQVRVAGVGVPYAEAGASVAVELSEERDLDRGGVIADVDARYARRVVADLCWLDEQTWTPGRRYRFRQGALETQALIEIVRGVQDMSTLQHTPTQSLSLNDIASVQLATRDPILADLYTDLPGTGAFVLFDPDTNRTAAAGMIREIVE